MIQPYKKALDDVVNGFPQLTPKIVDDSDYSSTLATSGIVVEFSGEPHYPGLSTLITNGSGSKRSLRLLREVLAPEKSRAEVAALAAIRERYDFEHRSFDAILQDGSLYEYAYLCFQQAFQFILEFRNELSPFSEAHSAEYAAKEQVSLAKLGIKLPN